jgi:CubicO group peptidase (beta-lactamase class C family)
MRVNRRFVLGGAAAIGAGAGADGAARDGGGKSEGRTLKTLGLYADRHRADWGIPGMTIALVDRDGYEGFVRSGWADAERRIRVAPAHLFQIGSITKMMTALACWSLIEDGKLSPQSRLLDRLKGVAVAGGAGVTLQHLLDHTSGLPSDSTIFPEGGLRLGFKPGAEWSYSNSGYQLAGMMAAAADGRSFPEVLEARVLRPLGMTSAVGALRIADRERYAQGYEPALADRLNPRPGPMTRTPWVDSDSPAGCVAATAGDMAIFMRFLLGLAGGEGGPVFSNETAKRFLAAPVSGWGPEAKYGNGLARIKVDGRSYLHHTGGMVSFCSALHVDVEAGVAAFASANVHYSLNYRPNRVTTYACELLRAAQEGRAAPAPKPPRPAIEKPETYAGVFTAADGDRFEIVVDRGAPALLRKGLTSVLDLAAPGLFATTAPDFAVTGVAVDVENDKAVRAWVGEKEFAVDPSKGYRPPAPAALKALSGRYDNDDRWAGPLYIYARDGALWVGNAEKLTPLGRNEFRHGAETWSPERMTFDNFVNGRPQRLLFSGTPYMRRFS